MAVYGYTKNYKLIKPQFDTDTWHDYEYDNLDTIDAVLSAIFASGDWQGFWRTNTHYDAGGVIIDRDTDTMYKIMVEHTTSEATFAEEFAANPTYYELWSPNNLAEDWAIKMDDVVSNTDYSSKAYAISSDLIDNGSAQEWAIKSGAIGTTGEYSAKKYATDAHDDYISMTTNVNVIAVGANIANVNAVGQSISNVNTVASDISSVNTVAGISTDVTTVASIANAVSNVSGIESEVLDVSDNRTDISTVASNIGDVNTVADISTGVSTVADNDANVTTVATNISDVNTAATNMTAIQNAPTAATNAANSATLAQEWASKMDGQVASTDYSSKYYAGQSATSASNSQVWAEGTDEQVQALGGVHSSKVWAEQSTNANVDLSNLTAAGNDKFVTKNTEQTISGNKTFEGSVNVDNNFTGSGYSSAIKFSSNGTAKGYFYYTTSNNDFAVTDAGYNLATLRAKTQSATDNTTRVATTAYVVAHRCTTAATTTSSASIYQPAIVVENYKNGDAWYRKWSDGWIEQGGVKTGAYANTGDTISLNIPFTGTNYTIVVSAIYGSDYSVPSAFYGNATVFSRSKTAFSTPQTGNKIWFACGY